MFVYSVAMACGIIVPALVKMKYDSDGYGGVRDAQGGGQKGGRWAFE